MEISALSTQNPWWVNPSSIEIDDSVRKLDDCSVTWIPRLFHLMHDSIDDEIIRTLRGPRQVGKTTLVKLMIKSLIDSDVEGRRIFYWSCDVVEGPKDLIGLLEGYIDTTRNIYKNRLYIFIDEISSVRDWDKGIKLLYDMGKLNNISMLLTGSHSMDIKATSERLPGRRGDVDAVYNRILVPMKFPEYVELRDVDLRTVIRSLNLLSFKKRSTIFFKLAKGEIPLEIKELSLYFTKIQHLFDEYLLTGGVIKPICNYLENGKISDYIYHDYVNAVRGDIHRWDRREHYVSQLIKSIIIRLTSDVSWNNLKEDTDIGSNSTVSDYVDILKSNYVLCPIYKIDRNTEGPNYGKNKKINFLDPFIFHALRSWVYQISPFEGALEYLSNPENKSKIIESIVCDHLIRFLYNLNPSDMYDPSLNVFYWSNRKEVDYVLKIKKDYLPIEVKYQNIINPEDYQGIYSFYSADSEYTGIVMSKNKLDIHNEISTIPVPLLLLLI